MCILVKKTMHRKMCWKTWNIRVYLWEHISSWLACHNHLWTCVGGVTAHVHTTVDIPRCPMQQVAILTWVCCSHQRLLPPDSTQVHKHITMITYTSQWLHTHHNDHRHITMITYTSWWSPACHNDSKDITMTTGTSQWLQAHHNDHRHITMTTGTSLGPESYDRDIRYRRGLHTANRSITVKLRI